MGKSGNFGQRVDSDTHLQTVKILINLNFIPIIQKMKETRSLSEFSRLSEFTRLLQFLSSKIPAISICMHYSITSIVENNVDPDQLVAS